MISTEKPWKTASQKSMDFQKRTSCGTKPKPKNLLNRLITHRLIPFDQIYRRKKLPITSLGGDRVQHPAGTFRNWTLCFVHFEAVPRVKSHYWQQIFVSGINQTPTATQNNRKLSAKGQNERQTSQLCTCAEHRFEPDLRKLSSWGLARFRALCTFLIDQNASNDVSEHQIRCRNEFETFLSP